MRSTAGCLILIILLGICAESALVKPKIVVHKTDMPEELERDALHVAVMAVTIYTEENDIAKYIKKEFDRKHLGTWQCIIGTSGYYVQWKLKSFIRFSVGDHRITLFKTS